MDGCVYGSDNGSSHNGDRIQHTPYYYKIKTKGTNYKMHIADEVDQYLCLPIVCQ